MKGTRQRHICLLLLCVFVLGCWKHCHAADAVREEEKAIDEKTFAQRKLQVSEDATDEENLYNLTRDDDSDKNNEKKTYGYVDDDDIGYHYDFRHESDGGRDYEREVERVDYHVGHDHHHDRDAHHHHHHEHDHHHHHDRDHHHHDRDHHHHDRDHHHHHRPDHRKQDENIEDIDVVEINTPAPKPHHHHQIYPPRPPTIQPPPVPNVTPCPPSEQVINFDNRPIRPIIPTGTIIPTGSSISAPCDGIRKLLTYKASAIGELMKGVLNFDCLKNCLDGRCCLTDCFASISGAGAGAGGSGTIGQPIKSNNNVMQQIAQLNLLHNICGANGGTRVQPTSPPTVIVSSPPGSARYLRRLSDEPKVAKAVTEPAPATNQDSESSNEAEELLFGLQHSPSKFLKTKEAPKYVNENEFMSSEEDMHSFEENDTTYNKHNVYGNKKQDYKTGNQLTDALLDSTSAISDHLLRSQTELNLGAPLNTIVNTFNALNEVGEQIENVFRAAIDTLETELLNYRLKLGLSAEPITNSQLEACIDPQAFSQFNLNEFINLPVKDVLCNLLYSAGNLAPIVKSEAIVL